MPFAQLRELVVALIESGEPVPGAPTVRDDKPIELHLDGRPACDRFAEGTIDRSAEPAADTADDDAAYRLTVTATNDRSDCAFVVDSPTQPTIALDKSAQDTPGFPRTDHHADRAVDRALDGAIAALDHELTDAALADDPVDDFDAQPTAYRVRTTSLDSLLATLPPR
jgi:hypothetical protein